MQIINQTRKVKCDIGRCKNYAEYSLVTPKTMTRRYINMCGECMREIYKAIGAAVTPKGVNHFIKNAAKRKSNDGI